MSAPAGSLRRSPAPDPLPGERARALGETRSAAVRAGTAWRAMAPTASGMRPRLPFVAINVARILATRLRETSQPLAIRL
ncbi:MAG TPA: hypothetical protein VMU15_22060 [Anaeromyxobacter sp.]|nr:hypothetical protein [Anaeromyxobacter sp.]